MGSDKKSPLTTHRDVPGPDTCSRWMTSCASSNGTGATIRHLPDGRVLARVLPSLPLVDVLLAEAVAPQRSDRLAGSRRTRSQGCLDHWDGPRPDRPRHVSPRHLDRPD